MKKVLVLLLSIFILCGCSKSVMNKENIDSLFDSFLSKKTSLVNTYSSGYKYYLPSGVRIIDSSDYNEKLYSDGHYYYLFVDMVSYYYKTNIEFNVDNSIFYSRKLNYNDNKGYAVINKIDDIYKIEVYYNYSKIETSVDYDNLKSALINIMNILNSIKYNNSIINQSVGESDTSLTIETFDFYTPRKEGNFIDYISQYDEYEEEQENSIGNEGNEG